MNKIIFNKKQLEIIAYFLHLNYEEMENDNTRKEMIKALVKLQKEGIWGEITTEKTN